jgi:hypothetical protein
LGIAALTLAFVSISIRRKHLLVPMSIHTEYFISSASQ